MASVLKGLLVLLRPTITIPLAAILSYGPDRLRGPLVQILGQHLTPVQITRLVLGVNVLAIAGLIKRVNSQLNKWALNNWKFSTDAQKWEWPREVAVITGGSSGIGLETVKQLLAKGTKVAVFDVQPVPKALQQSANLAYFECDVTDPASISSAAHQLRLKWGDPSILVNNAGIGRPQSIIDTPNEFVTKIFQINIISHFWLIKEFLPSMLKNDKGHIVGIASMASWVTPPFIVSYASTKVAVVALHEGLNQELKHIYKKPGVLSTIVHPSWVRTPLVAGHEDQLEKSQGKLLAPETIASAIVGQIVSCRGGQVFVPGALSIASTLRGQANWVQELIRDLTVGGDKLSGPI